MLRIRNKLTVLDDANSVFTDFSNEALDYDRDTFTITLNQSTSYLYVGFTKPINIFYIEVGTVNTNAGTFSAEYFNGDDVDFASLVGFHDDSSSLTRSGFFQWDRNQIKEEATTINGLERFWYRFRPTATHSATVINGLNIVFADDTDLKREYFEIAELLPNGESSHILTHVAARDEIIQFLRNSGHFKESIATGTVNDITPFDILDVGQIKLAATYLVLAKIFLGVQDSNDDVHIEKSRHFKSLYKSAIKTFYLDIDFDDDGVRDESEQLAPSTGVLLRR